MQEIERTQDTKRMTFWLPLPVIEKLKESKHSGLKKYKKRKG